MKKLLAIGDSFTYGVELDDRNLAFPYLLGDWLGKEVINRGVPSGGNIKMVRSLVEENIDDYDLVVIAWSGFDRIELSDEVGIWETWPGGKHKHQLLQASWRKTIVEYINRHHSDDYLYRQQYLLQIILAQCYLKYHKKNYVMLDAFLNHKFPGRFNLKNKDLLDKIDTSHFLGWPDESMAEWTKGVPIGPGFHFLEAGHKIVAEKIHKHILTSLSE
jgi:hypothetical protein